MNAAPEYPVTFNREEAAYAEVRAEHQGAQLVVVIGDPQASEATALVGTPSELRGIAQQIIEAVDRIPHVGHYSRLGGQWWCDTCDSPYCELA